MTLEEEKGDFLLGKHDFCDRKGEAGDCLPELVLNLKVYTAAVIQLQLYGAQCRLASSANSCKKDLLLWLWFTCRSECIWE